jgi:hypothetical protein
LERELVVGGSSFTSGGASPWKYPIRAADWRYARYQTAIRRIRHFINNSNRAASQPNNLKHTSTPHHTG